MEVRYIYICKCIIYLNIWDYLLYVNECWALKVGAISFAERVVLPSRLPCNFCLLFLFAATFHTKKKSIAHLIFDTSVAKLSPTLCSDLRLTNNTTLHTYIKQYQNL